MTALLQPNLVNLIWLEDREKTAKVEYAAAKSLNCVIYLRGSPIEIVGFLDSEFGRETRPEALKPFRIAFVIDIMISGLTDLNMLGVRDSDTKGGFNAGYVFVDRVLRKRDSLYRRQPVAFLTERHDEDGQLKGDLDYLRQRVDRSKEMHGPVEYFQKDNDNELQKFKKFLEAL